MIVEVEHPRHGKIKQFGVALKLSDTPGDVRRAAPQRGEHTAEVLTALGMSAAEIRALRDNAIVE